MHTNRYLDTRGNTSEPIEFSEAVVKGLADGGGLYVPEAVPHFSLEEICALADVPYAERAKKIYQAFGVDFSSEELDALMAKSYGAQFDTEEICPITTLDGDMQVLELWHGPTCAFKDMALQCLPHFFSASAQKLKNAGTLDHDFLILVATSGDTGKAALEGFKDVDGVQIAVLYPDGGVSDIQYRQMATQDGSNTMVWAVRGNFDDCQTGVKTVFNDVAFNEELHSEDKIALSSANSINWGRLMPQIVYYVSSYALLVARGQLDAGAPLDVCVPTGNFGNILAAWYAKQMGTPIRKLFCASNENRVLTDFIQSGTYSVADRQFVLTPSPSMDILISSNMERQLFELTDRDGARISEWMRQLNENGQFTVDADTLAALQHDFASASVDAAECLATIKRVYEQFGYVLDPHTAVAFAVAEKLKGDAPVLVASTAHWGKFGENVYRALVGLEPGESLPAEVAELTGCQLNQRIAEMTGSNNVPVNLATLDKKPIRFTEVISNDTASIESAVQTFLR